MEYVVMVMKQHKFVSVCVEFETVLSCHGYETTQICLRFNTQTVENIYIQKDFYKKTIRK